MHIDSRGIIRITLLACALDTAHLSGSDVRPQKVLAARGETPAAFGRRCIPPPPQRGCRVGGPGAGCVARRSHSTAQSSWYRTLMPARTRRAYLAWVAVCLIWGTTYLGIRIALETIPPLLMAAMRWIVAGGLLIVVLKLRGVPMPGRGQWPTLAVLGILLLGFGNGAVVWAEQTVPS